MKHVRWMFGGATFAAVFAAVACGSSSDDSSRNGNSNGDSGTNDATTGLGDSSVKSDGGTHDGGETSDSGVDAGPLCTATPCVVAISVGGEHTCALLRDATVRCWGNDNLGELGFGTVDAGVVTPTFTATPTEPVGLGSTTAISMGGVFDGEEADFSCSLNAVNVVGCWGANYYDSLGRGDAGDAGVLLDPNRAPIAFSGPFAQLSSGSAAACALDSAGNATCWGINEFGQVSATPETFGSASIATPTAIATTAKFKQISTGLYQVCATSTDDHVWCWGSPQDGETGRVITDGGVADYAPAEVPGLSGVTQVVSGSNASCALTSDGVAHCWGLAGSLGRDDDAGVFDPTPATVAIPGGVKLTQITAHWFGFCALDDTGSVWCWGTNLNGVDGPADGGDSGIAIPVPLPTQIPITDVIQISSQSAGEHVCALILGGSVKCWGLNSSEQLGTALVDGGSSFSTNPVDVVF